MCRIASKVEIPISAESPIFILPNFGADTTQVKSLLSQFSRPLNFTAGTSPRINLRSFHTLAPCHIEKWRRTCLKRRNLEHAEHERKLRDDTASLELDAHIDKVHKVVHWEWKKATSRLDLNELRLEKILQQGAVVDVAEQVCAGLMSSKDFLKNWENPKHRDVDGHYGAVLHWQTRRLDPWAVMICEGDKQKMKDPPVEGGAYKDEDGVWVRDGPIFEPLNDDDYEADYDRLRRVLLGLPETPQGDSEVSVPEDMDTTW